MANALTESILTSIKKLLGIDENDTSFDADVIIHINSSFMILNQLGVGPENAFSITDKSSVWNDFMSDSNKIELVKSWMHLKVKIIFDPPSSSTVIESINKLLSEFEWRLLSEAEIRRQK